MAAPTVGVSSTIAASTTAAISPTIPTHAANDILWATVVYWGPNTAGTLAAIPTPANWTAGPQVKQGEDGWVGYFWRRAPAAGTTVTFALGTGWDTGTDICYAVRVFLIHGCITTGDPFDATTSGGPHTATNQSTPAVTVSGTERLAVAFYGAMDDTLATAATGYTAGSSFTTTTGTDAAIRLFFQDNVSANIAAATTTVAAPVNVGAAYAWCGVAFRASGGAVAGLTTAPLIYNQVAIQRAAYW